MKTSKKFFFIAVALFLIIMMLIAIDFSQKTTWPNQKNKMERTKMNGYLDHSAHSESQINGAISVPYKFCKARV